MKNGNFPYYVGLDIGTESVGYAVTDKNYGLLKFKGEPMWGVHLFDEAKTNAERRGFRTARRRLDRRQQRVKFIREFFAEEIATVDKDFYKRIDESALWPEDKSCGQSLFNEKTGDYNKKYPTIHHLIVDLIKDPQPHDVRLVYLAVAWLVAHRGHFLSEISTGKTDPIDGAYRELEEYLGENKPWHEVSPEKFGEILSKEIGITAKYKALCELLFGTAKAPKSDNSAFDTEVLLKALCGGVIEPKKLFLNEEYAEIDKFNLNKSDDELAPILSALGDDAELILKLKALFDWSVLCKVQKGCEYISEAKVAIYDEHGKDLEDLKYLLKRYCSKDVVRDFLCSSGKYESYAKKGKANQEDFCKEVLKALKNIEPESCDKEIFDRVTSRATDKLLCPKQVNSDNRVIPHQVYLAELEEILGNAKEYLPFLNKEEDGLTVCEKIISVFKFKIPYFVGPLNLSSNYAWLKRRADGPLYPWNFEEKVDYDASEQAFINSMTNTCTYLPNANVLPKNSLLHEKFQMLNEINPISVNGKRLTPDVKQKIFNEWCLTHKKITKEAIKGFLLSNGFTKKDLDTLSGIDNTVKSSLSSRISFKNLMESGKLSEAEVETIIEKRTYTESKARFEKWLGEKYPDLSPEDRKYICSIKIKDFARLSRELICEVYGTEKEGSGEASSIIERMWNENLTLMEILSDNYSYSEQINAMRAEYFAQNEKSLDEKLSEMYISNSVKRSIFRTLDVVSDIVKATGKEPDKIFIETARGGKPEDKGKRTKSRYAQITELYDKCKTEDVRELSDQLEKMGAERDSRLQSDKLFLYYMQLGKCMYTGEPIDLSRLGEKLYDIEHIYPRSKVKDDSVLNNKVLVLSKVNADKSDNYPIDAEIRNKMHGFWLDLKEKGMITEEKYRRLTRATPFTDDEKWGFINRQLVETRQSTKAVASILQERYPNSEIVYVKAGLVSEFRQEFDLLKSREVNDLHHAKDAFLNVVVGNVYNERFTKKWFSENKDSYNLKTETLFNHPVTASETVWRGEEDITRIKSIVQKKNAIHLTRYATCSKGGLFNQQPEAKKEGLTPLKKGLPTEKYGGYNNTSASFFLLAKYETEKNTDVMLVPFELMHVKELENDPAFAEKYVKEQIAEIKGKEVRSVEFPLGMRRIKIGTVFEFDGTFRAYITGKSGGGRVITISTFSPLVLGYSWEKYVKRLGVLTEKKKKNPKMIYSAKYDNVTKEENSELYNLLSEKLRTPVYKRRPANPAETLIKGKELFDGLDVFEQASCLLQIVAVFNRINNGCNLKPINGAGQAAVSSLSSSLSNWKKSYGDVRIVDSSASGLFEHRSVNLLDLL